MKEQVKEMGNDFNNFLFTKRNVERAVLDQSREKKKNCHFADRFFL